VGRGRRLTVECTTLLRSGMLQVAWFVKQNSEGVVTLSFLFRDR
jgi:hypothetical protein